MVLDLNWKLEMPNLTYILHIETATKSCSVALSKNGNHMHCVEEHGDAFVHGERLALFIQQVLTEATVQSSDLSAISISAGPGSYTGLRIGVSMAIGTWWMTRKRMMMMKAPTRSQTKWASRIFLRS